MVDDDVSGLDGEGVRRAVDGDVTINFCLAMVVCLAVGFATGFKTALVREHSRLERNKQVLRRALKEVWSNPDLNAALKATDELYTPDFVLHDWTGDSSGLGEAKKGIADTHAAFPDWHEELLNVVAEGNIVVTRSLSTGTQKGESYIYIDIRSPRRCRRPMIFVRC